MTGYGRHAPRAALALAGLVAMALPATGAASDGAENGEQAPAAVRIQELERAIEQQRQALKKARASRAETEREIQDLRERLEKLRQETRKIERELERAKKADNSGG